MGSSVLTPGDGDPPTPLGLRARARPPGAKSPFYLLPETGGAGPPGPPCVWGVGVCVQSMRVCVCVCVCARAVVTAPRWAALVHVCERKWSWLCLLSCPAPQGLTPAAPRTLSPPGTQGPGRPAPPGSCLAARCPVGWGHCPWCSPRSPQPRWVYVCLFIRFRLNSDLFHIWFGNFQTQKNKKN